MVSLICKGIPFASHKRVITLLLVPNGLVIFEILGLGLTLKYMVSYEGRLMDLEIIFLNIFSLLFIASFKLNHYPLSFTVLPLMHF